MIGGLLLVVWSLPASGDDTVDVTTRVRSIETLRDRGEYTQAIDMGRETLRAAERAFGRDDRRTTDVRRALAAAHLEVGNRVEAEPLLREAMESIEHAQPADQSALGSVICDLAQAVEDPAEAESLGLRAVEIAERVRGPDHPATGLALNNLGALLREQGRTDEAEPLMRRALRIRERTEGMASPLAAQSLCTLGQIASDRGDISVAESLVRGSLARRRAVLPEGHPDTAESCLTLARILLLFGDDLAEEALALASEAFDGYEAALGRSNLLTLTAMHVKANALAACGRQAESENLHRSLVSAIEKLPSPPKEILSEALQDSARHLVEGGKPTPAAALCRRAIALEEKAHGPDDARTWSVRQVLAEALHADAKFEEAVAEGRAVLSAIERSDRARPLDAIAARFELAKYLLAVGETEEAGTLLERCVTDLETTTGPGSEPTLKAMYRLALVGVGTGELGEAERLVDDGLKRFSAADDVRGLGVATDLIGLRAVIYRNTGRIAEAEEAEEVVRQSRAERQR